MGSLPFLGQFDSFRIYYIDPSMEKVLVAFLRPTDLDLVAPLMEKALVAFLGPINLFPTTPKAISIAVLKKWHVPWVSKFVRPNARRI